MFIRKRKNRSGSTSVVVIDKSSGKYKELVCMGASSDEAEIQTLVNKARKYIETYGGQQTIDFEGVEKAVTAIDSLIDGIETVLLNGPQLILNRIYDDIGFGAIDDNTLRSLVIARLCNPGSKLATSAYLKSYFNEDLNHWKIYRYMDKLYNTQQERVQQISVDHTIKMFGGRINLMFYDVTSLYFETPVRDELRNPGFSKDGKTSESQIILGLLVSEGGYPLSYSVFNGSQYEGYTMIPIIDDFIQRFKLKDFVVVADSGLMSNKNIEMLSSAGYKYIIGARIRNESQSIKEWILGREKVNGALYEHKYKGKNERLIVGYSDTRAAKDNHNRERGVNRLKKLYANGSLSKDKLTKRGYNKFLEIDKDIQVVISQKKIEEDALWDGFKGYKTNTNLSVQTVVDQYHGLWVVERAFRISKDYLEMRPIFHFTEKRIQAHICICFVAYKVYKELQRQMTNLGLKMSVDKALDIAKTVITLRCRIPGTDEVRERTILRTPEQQSIKILFDIKK